MNPNVSLYPIPECFPFHKFTLKQKNFSGTFIKDLQSIYNLHYSLATFYALHKSSFLHLHRPFTYKRQQRLTDCPLESYKPMVLASIVGSFSDFVKTLAQRRTRRHDHRDVGQVRKGRRRLFTETASDGGPIIRAKCRVDH